jgi:hypothetical protein
LSTKDNEILSPKVKIRDLLIFNPDCYQNLYLVHNFEKTDSLSNNNNSTVTDKINYCKNNINYKESKYGIESEKIDYRNDNDAISDLNKKYDTNSDYGKYNRSNLNEKRPFPSLSENQENLFLNRKESEKLRDLDDTGNRFSNQTRLNYLKDSKEDDLLMSTINTKNDLGNIQQPQDNNFSNKNHINKYDYQIFQNSESDNIIRENYENYRLNNNIRDRKEFIDISSDNNTIANNRDRFNSIYFKKII